MKELEIIGEAASRIEASTRAEIDGVPWQEIIGMRNRLIHAYFSIDLEIVWTTITVDLPALIHELERALKR